jgi:serine/threonine protein kinase
MVEAKNYESQYTEGQKLGQGAFGIVILVTHIQEKKKYVAKKMKFELTPFGLDKCLKEVELLRSMEHPNIVPYKDHFVQEDKDLVILIMEYCECKSPVLSFFSWGSGSPNRADA